MKILITGANGLLGSKLVTLLIENGEEVIATSRGASRFAVPGSMTYSSMDVTNEKEIREIFDKHKPEAVIHTAAMTHVDQCEGDRAGCWKQNVEAVKNLVKVCEEHQSFLLHLSTDFIFDGTKKRLLEDEIPGPVNYYGESKLASERLVTTCKTSWAIARTVLVYGITRDMSRSNIILWVKESLSTGKTIKVVDDQYRTPTLAEDLAMGCYLIVKKRATGVFNISGKDMLTPYEMAIKTADYFGLDKGLIEKTDSTTFKQPARRPLKTGFNINKAKNILGYNPRSFDEGIAMVESQVNAGL